MQTMPVRRSLKSPNGRIASGTNANLLIWIEFFVEPKCSDEWESERALFSEYPLLRT